MNGYKSIWCNADFVHHLDGVSGRVEVEYDCETLEISEWEIYLPIWGQPDYPMSDRLTPDEIQRIDEHCVMEIKRKHNRNFQKSQREVTA